MSCRPTIARNRRCSRAASRAPPRCPRRTRSPWRRPSRHRQPERGFAQAPDAACAAGPARGSSGSRIRARRSRSSASSRGGSSSVVVAVELDEQERAGSPSMKVRRSGRAPGFGACCRGCTGPSPRRPTDRARGSAASPRAPRADRANWMTSTALAFGSGTSASFASTTTPSVPSEPTISFARLNGSSGRRTRRGCSRRRGAGSSG